MARDNGDPLLAAPEGRGDGWNAFETGAIRVIAGFVLFVLIGTVFVSLVAGIEFGWRTTLGVLIYGIVPAVESAVVGWLLLARRRSAAVIVAGLMGLLNIGLILAGSLGGA